MGSMDEIEIVDPEDVVGPVHVMPLVWSDEKYHVFDSDCWCEPRIVGQLIRHRSVFDDRD